MSTDATKQPMSKSYAPIDHEARIWDKWMASGAFHADPSRVLSGEAQPYTILIPPPNVTAALHLGHALNNSIQDILIRAHRMKGFETLWMPGTDHAGIATQTMVDKKLKAEGKPGIAEYKKMELEGKPGREEFLKLVHEFKDKYEERITDQLMKMGCSCDWERQRFTMDDICARAVREAFFQLFKDGLIYRGKRLVNWDPVTQTALADDEVEMEDVEGFFWYMKYPVVDADGNETGEFITVATTRPETFLGDTGVAVNPNDPKHKKFIGQHAKLPFVNRIIPIIGDDYVVMADPKSSDSKAQYASGFLKVTPAHDPNDWMIGLRHDLEVINIMAPDASISDQHGWEDVGDAQQFVGLSREDARIAIEKAFDDAGLLEAKKPYTHAVGHSYRSHAAIEPYLSDQWYCKVTDDKLRGNAQRALVPEQRTEASIQAWPESAPSSSSSGMGFQPVSSLPAPISDSLSKHRRHLPHWQFGGSTYFVTFRVNEGELSESERQQVLDACFHFDGDRVSIKLATIMPDHVHLLVTPLEQSSDQCWALKDIIHSIKSFTANSINRDRNTSGSLWQDEYFDRIMRDQNEFDEKWNYMLNNPVKAGICTQPNEYAWTRKGNSQSRDGLEAHPTREGKSKGNTTDGSMSFFPSRYAKTYETWHDNLRDWCISRQLWWGHRIPVWHIKLNSEFNIGTFQIAVDLLAEQHGCKNELSVQMIQDHEYAPLRVIGICSQSANALSIIEKIDQLRATFSTSSTGEGDNSLPFSSESLQLALDVNKQILSMHQDPDVLDTWFSSALWPLSTMGWPNATAAKDSTGIEDFESMLAAFNPTSVLTTAREIITLWVSRMTMFNRYFLGEDSCSGGMSDLSGMGFQPVSSTSPNQDDGLKACPTKNTKDDRLEACPTKKIGPAPFKEIFIHAMIQDGDGRKMSKMLGNGLDPLDIIYSHGADAMRFTLCQMTTQTQDVRMPVELDETTGKNTSPKFDLGRNLCNKLWNAAKFSIMMLEKNPIEPGMPIDPQELTLIDRWMLSRVVDATNKINTAQRNYMFKDYADTIYDLFWRDFCDWYLESIKPTIADNPNQRAVLRLVFEAIIRLMHPVMPFITETLSERFADIPMREITGFNFAQTRTNETLCQSGWPEPIDELRDEVAEDAYDRVRSLVSTIREIRAQSQVAPKRKIVLHAMGSLADDIARWSPLVETLAGVESISSDTPDGQAASFTFEGSEYQLSNLADALDEGAEKERLTKELTTIEKSIKGIEGRLSNPGYTDKAPAHLVQQTRDQLAGLEKDRDATKSALDKLG